MFKGLKREKRKKIDTFRIDCCVGLMYAHARLERVEGDDGQMPLV